MLIIPFERPIDWRRPPLATIVLVTLNVLVFLLFQLDDHRELGQVKSFYYESGLAQIELPHYKSYLEEHGEEAFVERFGDYVEDPSAPWFDKMMRDDEFLRRLKSEQIVTPSDSDYTRWRKLRTDLEERLDSTTVWGYGLRPADTSGVELVTHMFLHGGVFHLIGNMIFLVALGLLVEIAMGSLAFLGLYLVAGLGAVGLFIGLHPQSLTPLVGASGAVAGLMGLCSVVYGRRPIRFFYFVGVYFDYVRAPALALLALWLGKELIQYWQFAEVSGVAYTAHIGGLVTGAVAGAGLRFATHQIDEDVLDEHKRQEEFDRRIAEANQYLDELEPERARPLFERLQRQHPDDLQVLDGLFRANRFRPGDPAYHDVVHRILALDPNRDGATELILAAFRDYRARARPKPRVDPTTIERMVDLLLRHGSAEEAEPLVRAGLKHPERFPHIPDLVLRLAQKQLRTGERDKARALCRELIDRFPQSDAAHQAERLLTRVSS